MPTRAQALVPVIAAAVVVGAVGLYTAPGDAKLKSVEFPRGLIKVDGTAFQVQVADTDARRVRGLMFQDALPYDEGMLFVFGSPGNHGIWMSNMQFAIDVVWFSADGRAVAVSEGVQPCTTVVELVSCVTHEPGIDALYVLEATAGFVEMHGIEVGSVLEIISA
ncbi:MAG: DUF192 domain-containing protein [Nitrosopumilus sp.]|nr:DUF192 domain-containing protein [Nitrosopumilus sp.]CAI9831421.1 conserved hypothetical protein [Nitrosopumilaceae archaeon]MDA7940845.1 DUF192 domain-containing protein [Nitrosopumilus sp.]MDA7943299.1 DUF192 domain-containing protein [Nitrosopumilus sp.]MDA7944208.1 DUF192 domain-containing protein [Nitrosopumilus sp.]